MRHLKIRWLVFTLMLAISVRVVAPVFSQAQPATDACVVLAKKALEEVGQSCANMERNTACYGFNRVGATFFEELTEDTFSKPSDRTPISLISSIETSPLDEILETWGIAVLRLQANLPNTLPGQNVIFILMGDTHVQNAVTDDQTVQPSGATVEVTAAARARLRSSPSLRANVVQVAESGQALTADAVDPSGGWVRVVVNGMPGWMSREVLSKADFSALPVLTEESRTPMQSFYLTTGLGDPQCSEAPSLLIVQGPKGVTIDLTVNEARIQISSTIILRLLDADTMEIIVLDGQAVVNNLIVPAGFRATAPISGLGGQPEGTPEPEATPEGAGQPAGGPFPIVGGAWQDCEPLSPAQSQALQALAALPAGVLNYLVTVPGQANGFCQPPGGQPPAAGRQQPQTTPEPITVVDCTTFAATSPLDGAALGPQTFFWNPAPGATAYRVNLFRANGSPAGSFETFDATTNIIASTLGASGDFQLSWNVEALLNGQVVCTSPTVTIPLQPPSASAPELPPQSTPEVTREPPRRGN